jgi:hypothetical protein
MGIIADMPKPEKPVIEQLARAQTKALLKLKKIIWKPKATLPDIKREAAKVLQELKKP